MTEEKLDPEIMIRYAVEEAERVVSWMYSFKFKGTPKPPPFDQFKASAMAEIARRIRARAVKIEEDWDHFTRS